MIREDDEADKQESERKEKRRRPRRSVAVVAGSKFGRVPDAERRSGLRRSKLYELAGVHKGLFLKADNATIVDLTMLDRVLAALPPAEISGDRA